MVETGPLAVGNPGHAPYDVVIFEGAVEQIPEALLAQVKPGGRIAAIFAEGSAGQARLGLVTPTGVVWRRLFDASAPVLPGFAAAKEFVF